MSLLWLGLFAVAGFAFGAAYFHALRKNAELYLLRHRRGLAIALHVARLLFAAGVFFIAALAGAAPLLVAFAGFVVARYVFVRTR